MNPFDGMRCMSIWMRSVGLNAQADDLDAYAKDAAAEPDRLISGIREICEYRGTQSATRARLRHLVAGVPWQKVKL